MSIAIFIPTLHGGGAERNMLHLAYAFADRGHRVYLVLGKREGPYRIRSRQRLEVVDLGASRIVTSLPRLVGFLRRNHPDVLLSTLPHANVIAILGRVLARVSTRVFVREANTISEVARHSRTLKGKAMPYFVRCFYPAASGVIAVSEGVARDLERTANLDPQGIRTIYNPVVTEEILREAEAPMEHPWFVSGEPPVILGAGSLVEQKGFDTLIRAFAMVRERIPCRLMILGEGKERDPLRALADDLDCAADLGLPGFVDNPFAYMKQAAVFVLSSRWEGLPNVLIQAMAVGTPVVSTDCPSGPREILKGGTLGPLVPVGNPEALADAIEETLQMPEDPPALRERAGDFRAEIATAGYLEAFQEAL